MIIDECQTLFRSQTRVDPEVLRLLEVHRHYGLDVVLMCQDYRQMTQSVTRLVEVTTKFRRLDRLGVANRLSRLCPRQSGRDRSHSQMDRQV